MDGTTYADLLYSYFRNTMIHGYSARGVFLNHELHVLIEVEKGFLVLNPLLFWNRFKELFAQVFDDLMNNSDSVYRNQCKLYLERALK